MTYLIQVKGTGKIFRIDAMNREQALHFFDQNNLLIIKDPAEEREVMRLKYGAKATIQTADGEKKYYKTEVEDENGRWGVGRDYSIKSGYWAIHEGKYHHVYN